MMCFCYFLLKDVGVGEIRTDIALEVEETADSIGAISELVLTVSEIETKTDDGEGITDEWTLDLEVVIDNVVIEELLNE